MSAVSAVVNLTFSDDLTCSAVNTNRSTELYDGITSRTSSSNGVPTAVNASYGPNSISVLNERRKSDSEPPDDSLEAMMSKLFWSSDTQWAAIEPHLPKSHSGARRVDDWRVISGIIHVLKTGRRWCDCPPQYGPSTTI